VASRDSSNNSASWRFIGLLVVSTSCGQASDTPAAASPRTSVPEVAETAPAEPASPPAASLSTTPVTADPAAGQQVYRQTCAFCHDKGIAGAPRVDDSMVWGLRLAQGVDALYASAIHGKGAMPARGGNPALTEADIEAAVDYMLAQSR
jgi:cytochrome c5